MPFRQWKWAECCDAGPRSHAGSEGWSHNGNVLQCCVAALRLDSGFSTVSKQ